MRRLLTPRMAGLALALLAAVAVCVLAGRWQWSRYEEAATRNAAIEASKAGPATPLADVLRPEAPVPAGAEYRLVEVRGSYDAARALVVRLRPRDGQPGSQQLVPLRTADGAALIVDRGWYPDPPGGSTAAPPPPTGTVTVQARLRLRETDAGPGSDPATGAIRFIDVPALRASYPYPIYTAYGDLVREQPHPAGSPALPEVPGFTEVLHVAYTVQWYLFAVLALIMAVLLGQAEVRGTPLRARRRTPAPHG